MNLTIELLKVLGSPYELTTISINQNRLMELSRVSEKNRMLFFYLDKVGKRDFGEIAYLYDKEYSRYVKTNDAIARASKVLSDANIEHAFFKTVRPYTSTTVDLDILILKEVNCFLKSVKAMQNAGYELIVRGPRSTTLCDREADIGVDLYEQVAVSFLTYMDKQTLVDYSTTTNLPNGENIRTLTPEADLACIIAHSMIKEQMYTLSEYYTYIFYLRQMNIKNFLKIVTQNHIKIAARTHTAITALLHYTAHKTIPKELQQILKGLGGENFETTRLAKREYKTPHKYHPITIAKSLLEITKGRETRKSIATQLIHMLEPQISKDFIRKLTDHVFRETY